MKSKKILSLLLALTVMATMLMAVPITGYADTTDTYTAPSSMDAVSFGTEISTGFDSFKLYAGDGGTKLSSSALTYSTQTTINTDNSTCRIIGYFVPSYDGSVSMTYPSYSGSRRFYIAELTTGEMTDDASSKSGTCVAYETGSGGSMTLTATVEANTVYFFGPGNTGVGVGTIAFTYTESTDPTVTASDLSINAGESSAISPTATNFSGEVTYSYELVDENGDTASYENFTLEDDTVTVGSDATNGETAYVKVTGTYTPEEGDAETASCIVTVTAVNVVSVTSVTVSATQGSSLYVGAATQLTTEVLPADATYPDITTWTSSSTGVATVDSSGIVTAVSAGTTTITAATTEGVSGTIEITVTSAPALESTSGSASSLVAATESVMYDLIGDFNLDSSIYAGKTANNAGGALAFSNGYLYYDGQLYSGGSDSSKGFVGTRTDVNDLDGDLADYSIRLKGSQTYFAVKLADGSTVSAYVRRPGSSRGVVVLDTEPTSSSTSYESNIIGGEIFSSAGASIVSYTNTTGSDQIVYITALNSSYQNGGDSYLSQIQVLVGGEADSGYYTSSEQTVGVIRFLQSYAGGTTTEYGFYYVNEDTGNIQAAKSEALGADGFYADLYGISENDETTYSAIPYVTYSTGTITGDTISGSVDWTRNVDYEESAD